MLKPCSLYSKGVFWSPIIPLFVFRAYLRDGPWTDDVQPDAVSTDPAEIQLNEAYNIAGEANRTLRDAREAVRRVRAARGYFSAESNSGKGIVPSSTSSSSSPAAKSGGKSSAGSVLGPCFRCGMRGHTYRTYQQCPDRCSGGKGKSKGKVSPKGFKGYPMMKGKSKSKSKFGKGKTYYVNLSCILSAHWDADAMNGRALTRAQFCSEFTWGLVLCLFVVSGGQARQINITKTSRRTWHRPMIVQKLLFRCGASAISCGKRPSKKNIRFTVVCNPYRVLCCKTRRTNKVAFSLHRMRDLTASPVAVSKSKPVCSHLHC